LYGQHDAQWIDSGRPGAGNVIVFNNGDVRWPRYSSVDELNVNGENGSYELNENGTFDPQDLIWSWSNNQSMYAGTISGVQRLPNGNTLVTYGTYGILYEVNQAGEIVWEYISPIGPTGSYEQSSILPAGAWYGTTANQIFKARKFEPSFVAFVDKEMTPGDYLEIWNDHCPNDSFVKYDADGDGCSDDTDGDGVIDAFDGCPGFNDSIDTDLDGIIDRCDPMIDLDEDGIHDPDDECLNGSNEIDVDNDDIPDACDELIDNDGDGVPNDQDACNGFDDRVDENSNSIPDGCDVVIQDDSNSTIDSPTNETDTNETITSSSSQFNTKRMIGITGFTAMVVSITLMMRKKMKKSE